MSEGKNLWTQKAHPFSGSLINLTYFLYEFIGARLTLVAFMALFSYLTVDLKIYGLVLTGAITIFLFFLISDSFRVFWTGINLKYAISEKGISFDWGVFKDQTLFVPFESISQIYAVEGNKKGKSALIFVNKLKLKNGDFELSKEQHFDRLSFEDILNLEAVLKVLEKQLFLKVDKIQRPTLAWYEKFSKTNLFSKMVQLLALGYVYFGTFMVMKLVDNNILEGELVTDTIIRQDQIYIADRYVYNLMETKEGHKIKLRDYYDYMGKEIEFSISPIFKDVSDYHSYMPRGQSLLNNSQSFSIPFQLFALFVMFLSAGYIFMKRGKVVFEELAFLLLLPGVVLFFVYIMHL